MNARSLHIAQDEELLAGLAMKFRGTRDNAVRRLIAEEYAQTVQRLIQSGAWDEAPRPEDQLPDDWMPTEFFGYWLRPQTPP